jgi:hypothetical protein
MGDLVGHAAEVVRLRSLAEEAESASFELGDQEGDLSILLYFASTDADRALDGGRRFVDLAGLDQASLGRPAPA